MLEALDAPEGPQEDILDDVFRVGVAACVARQPPARPPPDGRQRALDQNRRRLLVARLRPLEDVQGRIGQRSAACTVEGVPAVRAPFSPLPGRGNTRQCHVIGRQLSHFYLIRTLGTGGMGVVYEAQDTRLPRSVAIKVIKDDLSKNVDAVGASSARPGWPRR